jgi:hypothetical protein
MTRDIILGLPPPIPQGVQLHPILKKQLHEQCLFYSGKFIEAIDRRYKL